MRLSTGQRAVVSSGVSGAFAPMSAQPPAKPVRPALPPVSTAVRQRLQAVFEHAQRAAEKADHDYAHNLFTECLVDDPANLIYLQQLLSNLAQKYGNNKKGSKLSALKLAPARMSLNKAVGKGQWREAFQAASDALKSNPWDIATLLAVADAYEQIRSDECQLYVLRWALEAAPKDVTVNRRAAQTLTRLGQFEQAISCWRRVALAKPADPEASKAISQLGVEQTIQKGGYQQEILQGGATDAAKLQAAIRGGAAQGVDDRAGSTTAGPAGANKREANERREQELRAAIDADATEISNYLQLADLYASQDRLRDAEKMLVQALAVSGGGDLVIRERLEEAQIRRAQQQAHIAQRKAETDKSDEAKQLARRMAAHANQIELEVYSARAEREPGSMVLQYELGLRYKRAGKFKEAIQAFQAARDDARHKALVQLHLGESFQHIRQFRLALASYEAAIAASDTMNPDTKKLALYRAGILAAELNEHERAEKYLTQLAAIDFGFRDVADRLDKLAKIRDSK
jgi:Tfp pilus assembly protein PilF